MSITISKTLIFLSIWYESVVPEDLNYLPSVPPTRPINYHQLAIFWIFSARWLMIWQVGAMSWLTAKNHTRVRAEFILESCVFFMLITISTTSISLSLGWDLQSDFSLNSIWYSAQSLSQFNVIHWYLKILIISLLYLQRGNSNLSLNSIWY